MSTRSVASMSRGKRSDTVSSKGSSLNLESSPMDIKPALSRRARKEAESRLAAQGLAQPKTLTKLPQASTRGSSTKLPSARPSLSVRPPSEESSSSNSLRQHSSRTPVSTSTSASSTSSTQQPRKVLRRRPSIVSAEAAALRSGSTAVSQRTNSSSSIPRVSSAHDHVFVNQGIADTTATEQASVARPGRLITALPPQVYPELDRYRDFIPPQQTSYHHTSDTMYSFSAQDFPAPPTPMFSATSSQVSAISGSPSTWFSGSPGPGPYSRDTTPTSMSSQSPGLVAPLRGGHLTKSKHSSPASTRPPVSRRRAGSTPIEAAALSIDRQGLVSVRESLTSSSSNSTVRDGDKRDEAKRKVGSGMSPSPPSPPPRKSSHKLNKTQPDESPLPKPRIAAQQHATTAPTRTVRPSKPPRVVDNSSASGIFAPRRPSRDGTPELVPQPFALPVIHSNLSTSSLPTKRQSLSSVISTLPRAITPTSYSDRSLDLPRESAGRSGALMPIPTKPSVLAPSPSFVKDSKSARAPSPSVSSSFKTRFPIFRRHKSTTESTRTIAETETKLGRKGPAAGTGHEGYGRLGAVKRRSNSASNALRTIPGTMSSQETITDQFLADRVNPVVIAGGEIIANRNTSSDFSRTDSDQSLSLPRPSFGSSHTSNSQASLSSLDARNTLWPSSFSKRGPIPANARSRRPSDSSDDGLAMKSASVFRRSIQRPKPSDQEVSRLPTPFVGGRERRSPSISSAILSDGSASDASKLPSRIKSPRKWNPFSRSQSQTRVPKKQADANLEMPPVDPLHKPVAFYAMMDTSEQEDGDLRDVEDVLREAEVIGRRPSTAAPGSVAGEGKVLVSSPPLVQIDKTSTDTNGLLDKPAVGTALTAPIAISQPTAQVKEQPKSLRTITRPSRLPQVGRIPKVVVSARPEQSVAKAFSRPFNNQPVTQTSPVKLIVPVANVTRAEESPETIKIVGETIDDREKVLEQSRLSNVFMPSQSTTQDVPNFFGFSPQHSPRGTTTTTESSSSGILSYSDATAIVPGPDAPLAEDEVWDEYNDMFGDETIRVPPSAGSSQGKPFHLEVWRQQLASGQSATIVTPSTADMDCCDDDNDNEENLDAEYAQRVPPASSVYSSDMTNKLGEMLYPSGPPQTPFSMSDFVGTYGDREASSEIKSSDLKRVSYTSTDKTAVRSSTWTTSSVDSEDSSPMAQVNLRVGSMTVSKWLTFGHVLFSPARDELVPAVGSLKRHSILVVDGLGNDDWSFYAAETYPAATFFNLSPRAPIPADHRSSVSALPLSPPNHHQIQYENYHDKFPFAAQSFTSVVFRFPQAAPEAHYRNIISEARRVLKPGGYIEMSILDVDMNNMGTRTRRAVRRLKEQIHAQTPDTSLASTADVIQRLLGRNTFTDVKTCRVGVPVASVVPASSSSSSSSSAAVAAAAAAALNAAAKQHQHSPAPSTKKKDDRSLPEMMSDASPTADESITRMVAKVGRWWYHRCYETVSACASAGASAGAGAGSRSSDMLVKSMFADKALLTECEAWGTTLKLMVCHARVPEISRVASI